MVDRRSLEGRLALIDRELEVVGRARAAGLNAYLADRSLQREVERALQLSIQACIDTGAHIVAAHGLGTPADYGDVFELLATRAELDRELADHLKLAAGQRNLLVHGYMEVDQRRLFAALDGEADLRAFAQWAMALTAR